MTWEILQRAWSYVKGDSPPEDAQSYFRDRKNWRQLSSSCLSEAAHFQPVRKGQDPTPILAVRFKQSGKVYWYLGVPISVASFLFVAPSKGKFYTSSIKGVYDYRGPIG